MPPTANGRRNGSAKSSFLEKYFFFIEFGIIFLGPRLLDSWNRGLRKYPLFKGFQCPYELVMDSKSLYFLYALTLCCYSVMIVVMISQTNRKLYYLREKFVSITSILKDDNAFVRVFVQ